MSVVIDPSFDPVPSLQRQVTVHVATEPAATGAVAVFVTAAGELPAGLESGVDRDALAAAGFTGKPGQSLTLPGVPLTVLIGVGEGVASAAELRDAAAAFARAAKDSGQLSVPLGALLDGDAAVPGLTAADAAQAVVEGATLARYRFDALKRESAQAALERVTLVAPAARHAELEAGAVRGGVLARATALARDLGNTPPRHLSAAKFAEVIERVGSEYGLTVEVFDRAAITELGLGGLLGVNAGSIDEPRMVKLSYAPAAAGDDTPHLALVGKGIMFDSGGISLKPATSMMGMKLDMMGAAAVFASMTTLAELGCETQVTGWLMCTDNMPSGSATKVGDVLTMRGGTTVEVKNTDAEGRLVLADGLVLATEETRAPDAIVDIATLTGNAMLALGLGTAASFANNEEVAAQLQTAADRTDERIWRLPLDHRYRDQLKSDVADLGNIGGQYGGAILAALFLNEFVGSTPWGHLDIAPTMQSEREDAWRTTGATGFGTRLLAELAVGFQVPSAPDDPAQPTDPATPPTPAV